MLRASTGRIGRLFAISVLLTTAVVVGGSSTAEAATVELNATCHGRNILNGLTTVPEDEGKTGTPLLPTDDPFPLAFGSPNFGGPTEVNAGAAFNAVAATGAIVVIDDRGS